MKKKLPYFLIALVVVAIILIPLFIKVNIECRSQFGECPAELNTKLQTLKSKKLFDAKNKAGSLLKKDFLVSAYSIQFKLPNIMLINIIVKKPMFAIKTSSGKFELVDNKGIIISVADSSGLPSLATEEQDQRIGQNVSSSDLFALNLVAGVNQMYQVGYGMIANDALAVDMPSGLRVLFPLEGDPEILLGGLRLIYAKVTTDFPGTYSQIDMRYKNPVLR